MVHLPLYFYQSLWKAYLIIAIRRVVELVSNCCQQRCANLNLHTFTKPFRQAIGENIHYKVINHDHEFYLPPVRQH